MDDVDAAEDTPDEASLGAEAAIPAKAEDAGTSTEGDVRGWLATTEAGGNEGSDAGPEGNAADATGATTMAVGAG